MTSLMYAVPAMGIVGLIYTIIKYQWVAKQDAGNERMKEISTYIAEGAMAFLKAEWKILGYFVVIVGILLAVMASSNLPHSDRMVALRKTTSESPGKSVLALSNKAKASSNSSRLESTCALSRSNSILSGYCVNAISQAFRAFGFFSMSR